MKKCPYCSEEIQDAAIYCRFCKHDLVETKDTKFTEGNGWVIIAILMVIAIIACIIYIASLNKPESTPTPYVRPSATPTLKYQAYFTPIYVTRTPSNSSSSQPGCHLWSDVNLDDVGKTMCVYGVVRNSWFSEQQLTQYFTFSKDPNSIYIQKFMYYFEEGIDGRCIMFTGKIYKSYNTPYMDVLPEEGVYFCD